MFRRKKETVKDLREEGAPVVPESRTVSATVTKEIVEEYNELANALGFCPGALVEEKLRHFLNDEGVKVYDYDAVVSFLHDRYGEAPIDSSNNTDGKPGWYWIPLRKKDAEKKITNGIDWSHSAHIDNDHTYQLQIPYGALLMVKVIDEAFPEVAFYVSGIAEEKPDPFLMVAGVGVSSMVIAHWDEPSFEGLRER